MADASSTELGFTYGPFALSAGEDAISVPARRRLEFNEAIIRFYDSQDGKEMVRFMAGCSLDP